MQKKLSFVLSVIVCVSLTNSMNAARSSIGQFSTAGKVASLAGVFCLLGAGKYAEDMNKKYARHKKRPDQWMAGVKIATAAGVLVGGDILLFGTEGTGENLVKLGVFGVSLAAASDTVANALSYIPCVGGILTGPINENGEEVKEVGAAARVLLTYVPLREFALSYFGYGENSNLVTQSNSNITFQNINVKI